MKTLKRAPVQPSHCRCIVCEHFSARLFVRVDGRIYLRCRVCRAIFLKPVQRLSVEEEYARYCEHRNDPDDADYRRFLSRLAEPLLQRLPSGATGLDYGCGPGPALACMLREAGLQVRLFDPFFAPDPAPLGDCYDFIVCSETVEHFHHPAEEFARFDRMVRPGGWIAVMTCFLTDEERFPSWHYRRDPTHVVFYRAITLEHVASRLGWRCEIPAKNVALMQKPER